MTVSRIAAACAQSEAAASAQPPSRPSHTAMEAGAQWYALLRSEAATPADRQRWQQWLDSSEEHRRAWQYVESISSSFAPLHAAPDPKRAAANLLAANRRVLQRRKALAGLALAGGGGALGWALWRQEGLQRAVLAWTADYRTGTGETRRIALPDLGSLWLNTASAVDLDYTDRLRRIVLVQGEIMVATAPDAMRRPLVVDSRQGRMRALGTRFVVRQYDDATLLAVYEGAVLVTPRQAGGDSRIEAGSQVLFTASGLAGQSAAASAHQAWTRGMLEVRDMSLRELAQELGRYWRGHIGVADEVAELRVFGSFPLDDVPAALGLLASEQPIRIRRTLPWWISVEARP